MLTRACIDILIFVWLLINELNALLLLLEAGQCKMCFACVSKLCLFLRMTLPLGWLAVSEMCRMRFNSIVRT